MNSRVNARDPGQRGHKESISSFGWQRRTCRWRMEQGRKPAGLSGGIISQQPIHTGQILFFIKACWISNFLFWHKWMKKWGSGGRGVSWGGGGDYYWWSVRVYQSGHTNWFEEMEEQWSCGKRPTGFCCQDWTSFSPLTLLVHHHRSNRQIVRGSSWSPDVKLSPSEHRCSATAATQDCCVGAMTEEVVLSPSPNIYLASSWTEFTLIVFHLFNSNKSLDIFVTLIQTCKHWLEMYPGAAKHAKTLKTNTVLRKALNFCHLLFLKCFCEILFGFLTCFFYALCLRWNTVLTFLLALLKLVEIEKMVQSV